MNKKKVAKSILKVGKLGMIGYITAYLGISAHVGYDFLRYNYPRLQQEPQPIGLDVRQYKVTMDDGREKDLTLVGENHYYNQTEHELAQKLVNEHQYFANECGNSEYLVENITTGNLLYTLAIAMPFSVNEFYEHLGNGRWYDPIDTIAEDKGFHIYALEDPNTIFINMATGEKFLLFGSSVLAAGLAPLAYYDGKHEKPFNPRDYDNFFYRGSLIDKRDPVMAQGIIDLLEKEEINPLLAEIGRAHLEGVISHLRNQVQLEEVDY